ncbi:uncharacterized protein PFL1_04924 [Pseudozyma flocculosa PF-1]|uniref:Uncharacterized protein n=1 Tax=Pseudozyma flocculosa PF-1 TaxID=1277687 RepID=A0A061H5V0_9BASI|nr:uncharacterized protein PFL1_04924 [Pseudozyma flocculosa PF-1]EPQ27385.1 hypothetical protein PFL1_04924 [Pseudozyma flocculosa PF-1]
MERNRQGSDGDAVLEQARHRPPQPPVCAAAAPPRPARQAALKRRAARGQAERPHQRRARPLSHLGRAAHSQVDGVAGAHAAADAPAAQHRAHPGLVDARLLPHGGRRLPRQPRRPPRLGRRTKRLLALGLPLLGPLRRPPAPPPRRGQPPPPPPRKGPRTQQGPPHPRRCSPRRTVGNGNGIGSIVVVGDHGGRGGKGQPATGHHDADVGRARRPQGRHPQRALGQPRLPTPHAALVLPSRPVWRRLGGLVWHHRRRVGTALWLEKLESATCTPHQLDSHPASAPRPVCRSLGQVDARQGEGNRWPAHDNRYACQPAERCASPIS